MEIIIAIAVVLAVAGYFFYKRADKNSDGKIDAVEAKAAVEEVKVVVQEAAKEVKAGAKKAAVKAKATSTRVSRAVARKTGSKKPAAKN